MPIELEETLIIEPPTKELSLSDRIDVAADASVLPMYLHRDLHELAAEVRTLKTTLDESKQEIRRLKDRLLEYAI